jgi:hypothetical protein
MPECMEVGVQVFDGWLLCLNPGAVRTLVLLMPRHLNACHNARKTALSLLDFPCSTNQGVVHLEFQVGPTERS